MLKVTQLNLQLCEKVGYLGELVEAKDPFAVSVSMATLIRQLL